MVQGSKDSTQHSSLSKPPILSRFALRMIKIPPPPLPQQRHHQTYRQRQGCHVLGDTLYYALQNIESSDNVQEMEGVQETVPQQAHNPKHHRQNLCPHYPDKAIINQSHTAPCAAIGGRLLGHIRGDDATQTNPKPEDCILPDENGTKRKGHDPIWERESLGQAQTKGIHAVSKGRRNCEKRRQAENCGDC